MIYNNLKTTINYINLLSSLFLVCVLVLKNYSIQNMAYFIFFGSYVVEFFTDKKWKNLLPDKKTVYFSVIFIFFLLALIYYPFDTSKHYFKLLIEKRYPLLGFSVVGILGVNHLYRLRYFILTIVVTSVALIIYILLFRVGITNFLTDPNLFNLARVQYVNTHMIVNFYFNSAIIGIWYLLSNYWNKINIVFKSGLILSLFLLLYALSISEGRTGFIFGLIVTIVLAFIELWKKKKRYGILFGFLIPWVAIILISSHKRMNYELIKTEPRYFLWEAGLSVVDQSPILGQGISGAQARFDVAREKYQTEDYKEQWIASKFLDCHNQYIQTTMEFGIIGLLILLYIYLSPYFLVLNRRKNLTLFVMSLVVFQSVFDMFITSHFGGILCLWLIFLLRTGKESKLTHTTTDEAIVLNQ